MTTSLESNLCNANLYFYIVKEKTYTSKQKKSLLLSTNSYTVKYF